MSARQFEFELGSGSMYTFDARCLVSLLYFEINACRLDALSWLVLLNLVISISLILKCRAAGLSIISLCCLFELYWLCCGWQLHSSLILLSLSYYSSKGASSMLLSVTSDTIESLLLSLTATTLPTLTTLPGTDGWLCWFYCNYSNSWSKSMSISYCDYTGESCNDSHDIDGRLSEILFSYFSGGWSSYILSYWGELW